MMIQRFIPTGPASSSMHYQIFKNRTSSEEDFRMVADLYHRVVSEDKDLCAGSQKNLNAGIFVSGNLHPRLEHGPLFFQGVHRRSIRAHYKLEQEAGQPIWPARQRLPATAEANKEDEALCSSLTCVAQQDVLAW